MKKSLLILLSIFTILGLTSWGVVTIVTKDNHNTTHTHTVDSDSDNKKEIEGTVVTSFYPEYIMVKNILGSIDEIQLVNLTSETTGCLHDYQLTSKDMKTLTHADALIINGGGMEPFIDDIKKAFKGLPIIDSSEGIELIEAQAPHTHNHEDKNTNNKNTEEHSEDEHDEDSKTHSEDECKDDDCNEHHHHGDLNAHLWISPTNYAKQVETITSQLCKIYPKFKKQLKANSSKYLREIDDLYWYMKKYANSMMGEDKVDVILFHDSFAYLSDICHFNVIKTIDISSDSALSAGTVADIISEIKHHDIKVLICEEQFKDSIADSIADETDAKVYTLDSLVSGDDKADSYIKGMRKNFETIRKFY